MGKDLVAAVQGVQRQADGEVRAALQHGAQDLPLLAGKIDKAVNILLYSMKTQIYIDGNTSVFL